MQYPDSFPARHLTGEGSCAELAATFAGMRSADHVRRVVAWVRAGWRAPLASAKLLCLFVFVAGLVFGVVGDWLMRRLSWFGDEIAVALPLLTYAAAAVALLSIIQRRPWPAVAACASVFVVSAVVIVVPRLPDRTGPPNQPIVLVAVNMLHDNPTVSAGVASALAQHPDVLVVSELTRAADELFAAAFPYRLVTEGPLQHENYAEGVYSTFPLEEMDAPKGLDNQVLRLKVGGPAPFILYAVHLPRPALSKTHQRHNATFEEHRLDAMRLDSIADVESGPVVIAGDLNLSDRTSGYAALAGGRHDALRTRWSGTTYVGGLVWELLGLRIDHIFVPGDWCAADGGHFTIAGSDHDGVRSTIGPCA